MEECFGRFGIADGFVAAVTVSVWPGITVVLAERSECFRCFRQNITAGFYEVAFGIIGFHVPGIIGNSVKGYFGSFRPFHRVGDETGHGMCRIRIESVRRSHQQVVTAVVAYREIPPDIRRALNTFVHPFLPFECDIVDHAVAGPHHMDCRVERSAQHIQIVASRPGPVIFGRTHDQRADAFFLLDKLFLQEVEQVGLFVCLGPFTGNIVEEDCEGADSQIIHHTELVQHIHPVFICPFNVQARMDRPDEVYLVGGGFLHEILDLCCFLFRIRLAPVWGTVVRIVFRSVDIGVHLHLSIKTKLLDAVGMAPGIAVKTFDSSTVGDVRIVFDNSEWQCRIALSVGLGQLLQCLCCVEKTATVGNCNVDFFWCDN